VGDERALLTCGWAGWVPCWASWREGDAGCGGSSRRARPKGVGVDEAGAPTHTRCWWPCPSRAGRRSGRKKAGQVTIDRRRSSATNGRTRVTLRTTAPPTSPHVSVAAAATACRHRRRRPPGISRRRRARRAARGGGGAPSRCVAAVPLAAAGGEVAAGRPAGRHPAAPYPPAPPPPARVARPRRDGETAANRGAWRPRRALVKRRCRMQPNRTPNRMVCSGTGNRTPICSGVCSGNRRPTDGDSVGRRCYPLSWGVRACCQCLVCATAENDGSTKKDENDHT